MWKIAWDNLWFNKRCSLLLIVMIAIAFSSINLFYGYVKYTREGMALGFIEKSGNFQIAKKTYWNNTESESPQINGDEILMLKKILNENNISNVECVLEVSGLIGNSQNSKAFWGEAYDNPEKYGQLEEGQPVFAEENALVLGNLLSKSLGVSPGDYVTLLTSSQEEGICLGDFKVSGLSSSGIIQQDKGSLIASRKAFLNFLACDDFCTYIKVFLQEGKNLNVIKAIESVLPENFCIKTWQQLNPSYKQIDQLNSTQFFVISFILLILIAVSLIFSLITNFTERLNEFGTMEAIGFKKIQIGILMELETIFMTLIGIAFGTILFFIISGLTEKFNIKIIPPGYSEGYKLVYLFDTVEYVKMFLLVCAICFFSALYPAGLVLKKTASVLMKR
jgi:putative ABC transport system permease protein